VLRLLQRFPGYTYSTLMREDARFLRLVNIADYGQDLGGDDPDE
jgi:hypothetical protein